MFHKSMSSWHYKTWFKVFFYEKFFFKMSTGIILSPLTWLGFSPHYLGVLQRIFYIVWLKNPRSLWQKLQIIKTMDVDPKLFEIAKPTSEEVWIEKYKSFPHSCNFTTVSHVEVWSSKKGPTKITILSYKLRTQNWRLKP